MHRCRAKLLISGRCQEQLDAPIQMFGLWPREVVSLGTRFKARTQSKGQFRSHSFSMHSTQVIYLLNFS